MPTAFAGFSVLSSVACDALETIQWSEPGQQPQQAKAAPLVRERANSEARTPALESEMRRAATLRAAEQLLRDMPNLMLLFQTPVWNRSNKRKLPQLRPKRATLQAVGLN